MAFAACCGAAPAGAQVPTPTPAFGAAIQVNVVNVDVVAVDRTGAPVTDLTRAELTALHDGQPVPISNFVAPGAAALANVAGTAATPQPVSLFVVLDSDNLSLRTRKRLVGRLGDALAPLLAGGRTRAMLVEGGATLRVRQPLGVGEEAFLAALAKAATDVTASAAGSEEATFARVVESQSAFSAGRPGTNTLEAAEADGLLQEARSAAQASFERAKDSLERITRFVDTLAGVPGRKVLLLVSEGIPLRPGEAVLRRWESRYGAASGLGFSAELESATATVGPQVEELAARANAAGVAFYCLDASLESRSGDRSAEAVGRPVDTTFSTVRETSARFALQSLSAETGGRTVAASGDLTTALAAVVDEAARAYSLGITIPGEPDGKRHTLAVEVARPGVQARLRRSYVGKTADQLASERVAAAITLGVSDNPLAVRLTAGTEIPQEDGTVVVPVLVHVPLGNLALLPDGDVHAARLSTWLAARDAEGRARQLPRQSFAVRVPNQKLLDSLGQSASVSFQLVMRPGHHLLAATLRDDLGGALSTATVELDVSTTTAPTVSR